jgi:hypothetical protein
MHGRKLTADNLQNNPSDDEVTDDEELQTDPRASGRRRHRLAQAACSTNVELQLQRTLVSGPTKDAQEKSRREVAKTQDFIGSITGTEAR